MPVIPPPRTATPVQVMLVRGDDAVLDFTGQSWWPADITGASITLTARIKRGRHDTSEPAVVLTTAGTVVAPTSPQSVRVTFTGAETAAALVGGHEYDVQAVLTGGEVVTLCGPGWAFTVKADQTV